MAGNAVIGALRVVLGADTAALDKGLSSAQKSLAAFGAGMAKAGTAGAAAFGAAAIALGVSIKKTIDEADNLGKMSQKIGIPIEELSALKHAADLSGVSTEALGKSVGKLSKVMVEAVAKPTSEAANAFKALGLSATDSDGKIKSSSTVVAEVAGKFENLKDGAGKTAIAMALFGKTGADLIPLLNSGKVGLEGMIKEAAELGIVLDLKTAKAAEAFNDNLTRLGKVWDGLVMKITAEMLPALLQFSQMMIDGAKNSELVREVANGIVIALKGVASFVFQTVVVFQRLGAELSALVGALKLFKTQAEANAAWAKFNAEGEKTTRVMAEMGTAVEKFWQDADTGAKAAVPEVKKGLQDINYAALGAKDALEKFIESQKKGIAASQAEAMTVGAAIGARERLKIVMQATEVAAQNELAMTAKRRQEIALLGITAEQAAIKMAGMTMTQEMLTPWEKYQQTLSQINQLLAAGAINSETASRKMQAAGEAAGVTWEQQAASMAGSFSQAAAVFGKKNKEMAVASKAFAITQAVINSYQAFTKALATLPPPLNFAGAAAALASGLAAVATISSQPIPSMAMGGAIRVPGGVGGGDKVPFSAMLEPGELVEVSSNRAGGYRSGTDRGGGSSQPVTIIAPDDFARSYLERLVDGLNSVAADGYRLKVSGA